MTSSRLLRTCALGLAAVLPACQGNVGSGGLTIPQTPPYNNPQGPGGPTTTSRQRELEGAVTLSPQLGEIPLPSVAGFSVAVELGTPPPSPAAGNASGSPAAKRSVSGAALSAGAVEAATLAPSAAPLASPSPAPSPSARAVASPVPAGTGSAPAATPHPSGSPIAAAKIATKTIAYPDDAPAAPTPAPAASGSVQTFAKRTAIVRGYLEAGTSLSLYGLGAIRFTIPAEEATTGRGFTVALFEGAHKHHETLISSDSSATVANGVVTAGASTPITLKKDTGYLLMLYGDELPSTPAPSYPSPGINPFVTPAPGGVLQGPALQTPLPGQPTLAPTPAHF